MLQSRLQGLLAVIFRRCMRAVQRPEALIEPVEAHPADVVERTVKGRLRHLARRSRTHVREYVIARLPHDGALLHGEQYVPASPVVDEPCTRYGRGGERGILV